MSKTLVTIQANSANEMFKKLTQAQAVIQLILDATQKADGEIENSVINDSAWLISDLLADASEELNKREYLKGGQDERI